MVMDRESAADPYRLALLLRFGWVPEDYPSAVPNGTRRGALV